MQREGGGAALVSFDVHTMACGERVDVSWGGVDHLLTDVELTHFKGVRLDAI